MESEKSMGSCIFGNILPVKIPECDIRKIQVFLIKIFSKSSEFYYLELGLDPSITDIFEAVNTLIQERNNQSESCITVKMSRRTQITENYLTNEGSGLACFSADLGHDFESNIGIEFRVMLRGRGLH